MAALRRFSLLAVLLAVLAVPATAGAVTSSGGVAPPSPIAAPSGAPTGGAVPRPPASKPDGNGASDIPSDYLRLYKAAGKATGVNWRTIAAIGKNESNHGRSTMPGVASGLNYARCCAGPMQMCTTKSCGNTWGAYAVDGNGDGRMSVYDPADAIYTAAALLRELKSMLGSRPKLILAGYNAGPGNVIRYGGVPPFKETQAYVKRALAYIAGL